MAIDTALRAGAPSGVVAHRRSRRDVVPVVVGLLYLLLAGWVTGHLWRAPGQRVQSDNLQDQGFFEFALAHAARSLTHLENPLFSARLNVPDGVNMMANTSILGLGIPLTPVTLLFGAPTAYATLLVLGLAGTAFAWYLVLRRILLRSRFAAAVAGGFCGFAPGMVSQADGHPNVVAQFVVPVLGWQVVQLCRASTRRGVLGRGAAIGALVTYQAFVNEEVLLFAAGAFLLVAVVYAVAGQVPVRRLLAGLAVAAGVAGLLLAYPLWFQFAGPQHYGSVPALSVTMHADLLSFGAYATRSLAGDPTTAVRFNAHPAEQNGYFGWALLVVAAMAAVLLWRTLAVRAAAVVAVVAGVLSLGSPITVNNRDTGVHGPFGLINGVHLVESVVPGRLTLVCVPALAVILGVAIDRAWPQVRAAGPGLRLLGAGALAAVLVPLFPTPLPAVNGPLTPAFVSSGAWRRYVPAGQSLVGVPLASYLAIDAQAQQARTVLAYPIPRGYFLGPPATGGDGRALYGAPPRPTATLLEAVARTGVTPTITDADRAAARADLRFWRAGAVFLGPQAHADALLVTVTALLGPAQRAGDVWLWPGSVWGAHD